MQPTYSRNQTMSSVGCGSMPRRHVRISGSTEAILPDRSGSSAASSMERTRLNGLRNSGSELESLRITHKLNSWARLGKYLDVIRGGCDPCSARGEARLFA